MIKFRRKELKAIFCSIIKSEEEETVIRDVWRRGFEEITTTREEFALPPEETILESLLEGRIEWILGSQPFFPELLSENILL